MNKEIKLQVRVSEEIYNKLKQIEMEFDTINDEKVNISVIIRHAINLYIDSIDDIFENNC